MRPFRTTVCESLKPGVLKTAVIGAVTECGAVRGFDPRDSVRETYYLWSSWSTNIDFAFFWEVLHHS